MEKEHAIASKKIKTITKQKTVIDLGEDLPIFSSVSNVDLENLNLSINANIKDLSANQRVKRFSKSLHQIYGPKTKL